MNNTKYYANNLAYDYDMFLPKEKRAVQPVVRRNKKNNIVELPVISGKAGAARRRREAVRSRLFAVTVLALLSLAVCLSMFMRAQVTEINTDINVAQKELEGLKSEEIRLQMELERKVSFSNIEQAAKALGMQKAEMSQINPIRTGGDSFAEVVGSETKVVMAEKEDKK